LSEFTGSIYRFGNAFEASFTEGLADLQLADRGSKLQVAEVGQGGRAVSELSMETPDEDAAEQAREVPEGDEEQLSEVPFEVDEADAAEQIRDAGYDDEDYR